ncbi:MAG: tyrosine-protein phosphatase [Candidatus Cryptobacteroides sp.]
MFSLFKKRVNLLQSGLFEGMTDRHSHILFGVDDGSPDIGHSLKILDAMESAGLKELWLTPHIMVDCPNGTGKLRDVFQQLKSAYTGNIRLNLAAEYMIDNLFLERLADGDLLMMENRMVLLETSTWSSPYNLSGIIGQVLGRGFNPVLAHPERYRYMDMDGYRKIKSFGVKFQLNLPSVVGFYGSMTMEKARELMTEDMYDFVGTDCHNHQSLKHILEANELSSRDVDAIGKILGKSA